MEENDYQKNWSTQLEKHKALLLPKYHLEVTFPSPPYLPEDITAYMEAVKPYLEKSRRARKWSVVLGVILFLVGFVLPLMV